MPKPSLPEYNYDKPKTDLILNMIQRGKHSFITNDPVFGLTDRWRGYLKFKESNGKKTHIIEDMIFDLDEIKSNIRSASEFAENQIHSQELKFKPEKKEFWKGKKEGLKLALVIINEKK